MAATAPRRQSIKNGQQFLHVSDSTLQAFLQQDFDPANFLNNNLPLLPTTISTVKAAPGTQHSGLASLAELAALTQSVLSQLNAQSSRISNTLTQLTDEILRSGGRLSYEVEVLKGEATALTDILENGLKSDIESFSSSNALRSSGETNGASQKTHQTPTYQRADEGQAVTDSTAQQNTIGRPEYIDRLRTLTLVRSRLESVIKTFGDAMQWPIAPSELVSTSSLISVSAPESSEDNRSREEKGQAYAEQLRNEINEVVGNGNNPESLAAAVDRVEGLRDLARVWKGTAEEKGRTKFVESLLKPLEEKQKALGKYAEVKNQASSPTKGIDYRYGSSSDPTRAAGEVSYSFIQNLQRIKNDMYLE